MTTITDSPHACSQTMAQHGSRAIQALASPVETSLTAWATFQVTELNMNLQLELSRLPMGSSDKVVRARVSV